MGLLLLKCINVEFMSLVRSLFQPSFTGLQADGIASCIWKWMLNTYFDTLIFLLLYSFCGFFWLCLYFSIRILASASGNTMYIALGVGHKCCCFQASQLVFLQVFLWRVDHPRRSTRSYLGLLFATGSYCSGHSSLESRRVQIYKVRVTKSGKEAL